MNLRVCDCCEFDCADPAEKPPSDRQTKLHYVKHGPIQPAERRRLTAFNGMLTAAVSVESGLCDFRGWNTV